MNLEEEKSEKRILERGLARELSDEELRRVLGGETIVMWTTGSGGAPDD